MDKDFIYKGIGLIKRAEVAYVTTIDSAGFPSTRAMFNLKNEKLFPTLISFMSRYDELTLFFTTNTSSGKINQIMNNPKVAIYYCDTKRFDGFMCQGEIEIVNEKSIKHALWLDEWKMYYPEGKDSEDYAVLRLKPSLIRRYNNLHQSEMKI